MANRKQNSSKLKLTSLAAAMILSSTDLAALGLGALDVQSNLDQPFNGAIELRVSSSDDLSSVQASIASREDFDSFGIDYPSYLSDMTLVVERVGGINSLRVSSNSVIINEPFIHFLVRIDWSGGSFLREYTALIDPPVYATEQPRAISQPAIIAPSNIQAEVIPESSYSDDSEVTSTTSTATTTSYQTNDAQYGPVGRGESLSLIAQELQRQFPDLSIYQIMKVLFDENQSSFINNNINGLMEGEVLNLGNLDAVRAVDIAQSKEFYDNQMNAWDPSRLSSASSTTVKVGQDEYLGDQEFSNDTSSAQDDINDAFQVGSSSDTDSYVSSAQGESSQGEMVVLQQEVTDLKSSLKSSNLEKQDLRERILILEGQLNDLNSLINLDNAGMAEVESTLADQNDAAELLVDDAIVDDGLGIVDDGLGIVDDGLGVVDDGLSGLEDGLSDLGDGLTGVGDSLLDSGSELLDDGSELLDGAGDVIDGAIDDGAALLDSSIETVDNAVDKVTDIKPNVVSLGSDSGGSFLDTLKDKWQYIGGLGGLIVVGLGMFLWRRKRADEEFEISMLSIEDTHNAKTATKTVSVNADSEMPDSVAINNEGSEINNEGSADNETSFLTVYSDSDAVVQADEVDPIAEADVYIAYGRDEQAEEVLLDGITSHPTRVDIKQKLLNLYHKNENSKGFERVAEELYSQKASLDGEVWQGICTMGKELLPNNPMFETSASELFVDSQAGTDGAVSLDLDETAVSLDVPIEDLDDVEEVKADEIEEVSNLINFDDIDDESDADVKLSSLDIDQDAQESVDSIIGEVSDLEIDADYDEARTQYELAKVFVDLGDDDGARKILNDIVDNKDNNESVIADAAKLLESINS